jgi:hypothetical protein
MFVYKKNGYKKLKWNQLNENLSFFKGLKNLNFFKNAGYLLVGSLSTVD